MKIGSSWSVQKKEGVPVAPDEWLGNRSLGRGPFIPSLTIVYCLCCHHFPSFTQSTASIRVCTTGVYVCAFVAYPLCGSKTWVNLDRQHQLAQTQEVVVVVPHIAANGQSERFPSSIYRCQLQWSDRLELPRQLHFTHVSQTGLLSITINVHFFLIQQLGFL